MLWNPTSVNLGNGLWDPRWEIWVEVTDNTKQRRVVESDKDLRAQGKTWRFLNTWRYPDGSFAPLDDRVFWSLYQMDSWAHPETYHELVEKPEREREELVNKELRETAYGARSYWQNYTRTQVGPGTRGDWRASRLRR